MCMESATRNCDGSPKRQSGSIRSSINANRKMMNNGRRVTYGSSDYGKPKVRMSFAKRGS
jgi:hypothetical protein